jgi:hypothetical protein
MIYRDFLNARERYSRLSLSEWTVFKAGGLRHYGQVRPSLTIFLLLRPQIDFYKIITKYKSSYFSLENVLY